MTSLDPQSIQREPLYQRGISALQQGQHSAARQIFDGVIAAGLAQSADFIANALACLGERDEQNAIRHLDSAIDAEPGNLSALILKGDILRGRGRQREALQCYKTALAAASTASEIPADMQHTLQRVSADVTKLEASFYDYLSRHLAQKGVEISSTSERFADAIKILRGSKCRVEQQPRALYYPGLPVRSFFEREEFPWVSALEAATDDICRELTAVMQHPSGFQPYIHSEEQGPTAKRNALLDSNDWQAFFLYKSGQPITENLARCPRTAAALEKIGLPGIEGHSPMALFSVLQPGTHIQPHCGFLNTRLICHLPLLVPGDGALRVGNDTRAWQRGKTLIFDDSIEHEAWNHSHQARVVLIFDIWRPELSSKERKAISALLEGVNQLP